MDKKYKIVVAEDDAMLIKALNVVLLSSNFEVISVTDGQAALDAINKSNPDAVLLDIQMPKMTGFEVLEKLGTDKTKKIPIIILSNLGQAEEIKKGMSLGARDYFVKSNTDIDKVVDKLNKYLK